MHRLFVALFLICGCSDPQQEPQRPGPSIVITGKLQDVAIDEASGLASSIREPGMLWVINDDGLPLLFAIDKQGTNRGQVILANARNIDWEDLASFRLDGIPYLLVADIGDNEARRKFLTLYVVAEADLQAGQEAPSPAWRIDYRYPDGPRDAEAVAVDAENARIFVLTKRDIPAILYELPLRPETDAVLLATRLGAVNSIPQPSRQDVKYARVTKDWYWQPTAMDLSPNNRAAAILGYRAVYYFERGHDEDWLTALRTSPVVVELGNYRKAESVTFSNDSLSVYVTFEKKHAPVLQIDFGKH